MDVTLIDNIRLEDLLAGKGEWTNLQLVLRKALAMVFEELSSQRRQIRHVSEELSLAKVTLNHTSDMASQFATKADSKDVEKLKEDILACSVRTENMVDMRYLETCLAQKADKTLVLPLLRNNDLPHIRHQCQDLNVRMEAAETNYKRMHEMITNLAAARNELNERITQRNIDQLWEAIRTKVDTNILDAKLAEKADKAPMLKQLNDKASAAEMESLVFELERSFAAHAETINALRDQLQVHEGQIFTLIYHEADSSAQPKKAVQTDSRRVSSHDTFRRTSDNAEGNGQRLNTFESSKLFKQLRQDNSTRSRGARELDDDVSYPSRRPLSFLTTNDNYEVRADSHAMMRRIVQVQECVDNLQGEFNTLKEVCFRRLDMVDSSLKARADSVTVERMWTDIAELRNELEAVVEGRTPLHRIESEHTSLKLDLNKLQATLEGMQKEGQQLQGLAKQFEILKLQLGRKADSTRLKVVADDIQALQHSIRHLQHATGLAVIDHWQADFEPLSAEHFISRGAVTHAASKIDSDSKLKSRSQPTSNTGPVRADGVTFAEPERRTPFRVTGATGTGLDEHLNDTIPATSPTHTLRGSSTPSSWSTSLNDEGGATLEAELEYPQRATPSVASSRQGTTHRRRSRVSAQILHELHTLDQEITQSLQRTRKEG